MADYLNQVPVEILDSIIDFVGPEEMYLGDLVPLARCNKRIHTLVEPKLYQSEISQARAMRWACGNDSAATIRLAVFHGAQVSEVRELGSSMRVSGGCTHPPGWHGEWRLRSDIEPHSTLLLASKSYNANAFRCLVELGATVGDSPRDPQRCDRLSSRVCMPKGQSLLRIMFEYGTPLQLKDLSNKLLTASIYHGAPEEIVRLIVNHVADPEKPQFLAIPRIKEKKGLHTSKKGVWLSPLSAAVVAGSEPVFDLLMSHGVNINAGHSDNGKQMPWHLPFFAAAAAMAMHSSTAMMQRCIGNGANFQYTYNVQKFKPEYGDGLGNGRGVFITPLLAYVDSIQVWDDSIPLRPSEGIDYLLGLLGRHPESEASQPGPRSGTIEHDIYGIWTAFQRLFIKFGIVKLEADEFFSAVKLLASRLQKVSAKEVDQLFTELFVDAGMKADLRPHVVERWTSIVSILADTLDLDGLDIVRFAAGEMVSPTWLIRHEDLKLRTLPITEFSSLEIATMDCGLASGADINAIHKHHPILEPSTILYSGCAAYRRTLEDLRKSFRQHARAQHEDLPRLPRIEHFAKIMMARGADPTIRHEDGSTAIEVLWEAARGLEESRRDGLSRLLATLTGEDPADIAVQVSRMATEGNSC